MSPDPTSQRVQPTLLDSLKAASEALATLEETTARDKKPLNVAAVHLIVDGVFAAIDRELHKTV